MAFPPLFTHFFGIVLQSICFGIYCVIFTLYLRIQLNRPERWKGLLLYALALNFILCTAYFIIEIVHVQFFIDIVVLGGDPFLWGSSAWLNVSADALYIAIDFISQAILFYRCWVMWRQLWVLVVPAIISIAFLVVSLMTIGVLIKAPGFNTEDGPQVPDWFLDAVVSFFTLSLVVNALLTGLIVYKILSVYRDIRGFKSPFVLGQGPNNLSPLISILIESGMITFITQLIQTIMYFQL
ncbi:hypothetical protein BYT27DRAFT_6897033 [Phlegmacium glaucopus]|nr:hypothetical protein BYT27DRAFT_6897033 [Phlegmacium glaucopus]